MDSLHNFFGLNIMPWRPPLDVLDEKIRPAIKDLSDRMLRTVTEFRTYRHKSGTVYAELTCAIVKTNRQKVIPATRVVVRFVDSWGVLVIRNESFDEMFKPPRSAAPLGMHDTLIKATYDWWLTKRPVGWNLRQHLRAPCINCVSSSEDALASAIARVEFAAYYKRIGNVFSC